MQIEHEVTTIDGEPRKETFWFRTEQSYKLLRREHVVAAFEYVRDNPDKFPEIKS